MHNIKLDQGTAYNDEQSAAGLLCAFAVNTCRQNSSVRTCTIQLATQTHTHRHTHSQSRSKGQKTHTTKQPTARRSTHQYSQLQYHVLLTVMTVLEAHNKLDL